MTWVFFLVLVLNDGELRELRIGTFATWQTCEEARVVEASKPIPDQVQGRVLRACRQISGL